MSHSRIVTGGCLAGVAVLVIAQLAHATELMDVRQDLTAGYAKTLVLGYAVAVTALTAMAALLPQRRLWVPVAASALLTALTLVATLALSGELWSFATAVLTMSACWQVGRWVLRALGTSALAAEPAVAWLAGAGILGLCLLGLGRAGALAWWTAGIPVLAVGALGLAAPAGSLRTRRGDVVRAVTGTRLAAASAAICVLLAGLASVWAAAPELMYDALYYKSWMPEVWADTGRIGPQLLHAVLNFGGFAQVLAVPGHVLGADGVGRYLQWLAVASLVTTFWWTLRRSAWAPVVAVAVAVTPQLFWQATTAYDDAILCLVAVTLGVAVLRTLDGPPAAPLRTGLALGLLAGTAVSFKIHLGPLAAGLLIGWLVLRGRRGVVPALAGTAAGGLLASLPPIALRWIDTGNPLFPAYNNVFKSQYWPPVHEQFTFPRIADPGPLGPLSILARTLDDTRAFESDVPVGGLGLLALALALALLTAWRPRRAAPALPALWLGLLLAATSWYLQFLNARYFLPAAGLGMLALGLSLGGRPGRRGELAALAGIGATAVALWPSTVAQFWNLPGRDIPWQAAFGRIDDDTYERRSTPSREALAAFDRLAPPGAMAMSELHERAWLTQGRDLTPIWEVNFRLALYPRSGTPEELLDRVRAAGVGWILAPRLDAPPRLGRYYALVEASGPPLWSGAAWKLYRLPAAR
jgi:hypothetical protein